MTKTALIAATALLALAPMTRDNPAAGEDRRAHPPTGPQSRFAAFTPSTYSAEARTVELVLSTGAAVDRHYFVEELEISATAVDIGRVAQGVVPLLDSHNRWGINANLGTIFAVRFETIGGVAALTATARFADTPAGREAEGMVARGELRGVSIGYAPKAWAVVAIDAETEKHTWRATSWELLEGSLVTVPADPAAGVRSAAPSPGLSASTGAGATPQEDEDMRRSLSLGGTAAALALSAARVAFDTNGPGQAAATDSRAGDPAATPAAATETRAAPATPAVLEVSRFSAVDAVGFVDQARSFGLDARAADLVAQNGRGEISVETARSTLLQAAAESQRAATSAAPAGSAARSGDNTEATREAIVGAIVARSLRTTPSDASREYMGVRLLELAALRAGVSPRERDPINILRAAHSSSDFPLILEAASNKILLERYSASQPTYQAIARRRDLRDFKATKLLRIGDFPTLLPYAEDGEIKSGTINEGRETVTLVSYGRRVNLTRQAIVNDDLGAFDDVFGSVGRMVSRFENATFYAMKAQNSGNGPKLADNINLFNASHANLAGVGAAPGIATLGAARAAMRKQTDLDGNVLNLTPRVLLVGPDVETVAQQLVADIQPVVAGEVNPFSGRLQVVAEGALSGNAWELYADPADAPVFSYGYLADAPGPRVLTQEQFDVDGMMFRVTMDFYTGATDFRGGFRNPGA